MSRETLRIEGMGVEVGLPLCYCRKDNVIFSLEKLFLMLLIIILNNVLMKRSIPLIDKISELLSKISPFSRI